MSSRGFYFTFVTSIILISANLLQGAKVGPIEVVPTLRLEIEGNDNVNTSGSNPSEDVILKARINFTGRWQITQNNDVNFDFGFGHERYLENPNLSSQGFLYSISPRSRLDFNIRITEYMRIAVTEDLQFLRDPSDLLVLDANGDPVLDVAQYNRFDSRFGIGYFWDVNSRTEWTVNLLRKDNYPLDDEFRNTERTTYLLSTRITRTFGNKIVGGLTANSSTTRYAENFQNDGIGYGLGIFLSFQFSPNLSLEMNLGYNWNEFESNGTNQDNSDPATWVTGITLRHSPNKDFSYSLAYDRTEEAGFVSNTVLRDKVLLSWAWLWSDLVDLSGTMSYEWASNSGGLSPEDFERLTSSVRINYVVGPRSTLFLEYRYVWKTSNLVGRTFDQNRIRIGIDYKF